MHQHPRPSPRTATPANNPTTNPERTNNSRDAPPVRSQSRVNLAEYTERVGGEDSGMAARTENASAGRPDRESTKLNQIIQNFHTKAALMICSSRANLPQVTTRNGEIKQNRWFNIVLDETDVLIDDLQEWRRPDLTEIKPPPLIIEVFVDTAYFTNTQALVLVDDSGDRWDVADAVASRGTMIRPNKSGGRHCEVILERWTIELGESANYSPGELNDLLPNVYKKGVVLFRSLYTFLRFLPAWKLHRKLGRQAGSNQSLKLKFRIQAGLTVARGQRDPLYTPLCPSEQNSTGTVEQHEFASLVTPAGPLSCRLEYRLNCNLTSADADSLLSSRFLGQDVGTPTLLAGRSLPSPRVDQRKQRYSSTAGPSTAITRPRALLGAYGSLGTFHATEKLGSPVSELKQRAIEGDEDDEERDAAEALQAGVRGPRRTSVNFLQNPPFKAGSLASSPRPSPSPSTSAGRYDGSFLRSAPGTSASSSRRISLNTLPQQHLRTPSTPTDIAVASPSSASPKPVPVRYSSSFANRPRRFTSQSSKAGESNASSGRGSTSSKEKSAQFNEGTPGSSGSAGAKTEDDDIASFISDLEKAKDSPLIRRDPRPGSPRNPTSHPVVTVNLSKYASMRDPSTQLAEEMSSSSLIHTSITPPSRRLSNVPGLSTSSSPSRALAHAPHVRSRLSTHSIVEEASAGGSLRASNEGTEGESPSIRQAEEEDEDLPFIFQQD